MRIHSQLVAVVSLVLANLAVAQVKYAVTPAGYEFQAGSGGNTFPLGRASASYQQIHDATDLAALNGGQTLLLSGMHFRPSAAYSIVGRTFDVQITLSATQTTAATMSTTFAANLGPITNVVLPYTILNLPSGAGTNGSPNPPLWMFPYKNLFLYSAALGNLCWDWRQRNSTSDTSAYFDSVTSTPTALTLASVGTGCTATGQSSAATSKITPSGSNLIATLTYGRANAPAFAALGLSRSPVPLWCGTLHVMPTLLVAGVTDGAGTWSAATIPSSVLTFTPYAEVFLQYAFADNALKGGVGLSNYAVGAAPANGTKFLSRLWSVSSTTGAESATTGSKAMNGLVTMFTIL